jgi:hypothetical protein
LTGRKITFGNFSLVPRVHLSRLVYNHTLWNNYAATLLRSAINLQYLPTERGHRYVGKSSMNTVSLIIHGLSAISIFIEVILTYILLVSSVTAISSLCLAIIGISIKIFTSLAIPGWASIAVGFSCMIFLQSALFSVMAIFMMLAARSSHALPPISFYKEFIKFRTIIYPYSNKHA